MHTKIIKTKKNVKIKWHKNNVIEQNPQNSHKKLV